MTKPETMLQRAIEKYLYHKEILFISHINPTRSGEPDIIACVGGKYVEIEIKTLSGRIREVQLIRKKIVENSGGIYAVVRSVEETTALVNKVLET